MKEITRIHLAQTPFNAELGAKKELEKYLAAIEKTLAADDDTLREIETRIVELLAERGVTNEKVITQDDIEAIKDQLGAPAEFADEQEVVAEHGDTSKRLMRNTERGLLGGVSAGIADYFGVNVMWPRLIAVLLTFISFGTAVVVYVVLWLVIPPAKTAAEKLQMRGEPVTLQALKDEASTTVDAVAERSKPFVIVLRVLLGLGFVAAFIGAIAVVILAVFAREPLFGASMHDLVTNDMLGLIGGAYVAAIVAGLLFAVLMALAAYASFVWTINRRLVISSGIVIVLGLASFATAIALGAYGSSQVNQRIEQSRTTETVNLSQFDANVKRLVVTDADMPIEYRVTTGRPYIELHYLRGREKPRVTVSREGDEATVTVKREGICTGVMFNSCSGYNSVVMYGPALESLTTKTTTNQGIYGSNTITYKPDMQSRLSVAIGPNDSLTIDGGRIAMLDGSVKNDGALYAEDGEISSAKLNVATGARVSLGALDELALVTPQLCNSSAANITYRSVNGFTINDAKIVNVNDANSCVLVNDGE